MAAARPLWEQRFRAATRTFPHWGDAAPERLVFTSDEDGSFQTYAWDRSIGTVRRLSEESVGVELATISRDGSEAVWFSDPTGDESGRWVAVPFEGGPWRDVFPDAPIGWPDGLAVGRDRAVGVLADRGGFAVYVAEGGEPAREIFRHSDYVGIASSDYHGEGIDHVGLSADETLVCVEVAQDGDNIHHAIRIMRPDGELVGELRDGPGLGLSPFAWSPVPGDPRLLLGNDRSDLMRPTIWNPLTGERVDLEVDLPGEVVPSDWWPDARSILVKQMLGGRIVLHRVALDGGPPMAIDHPPGDVLGAGVRPDGAVWLRLASGDRASRIIDDRGDEVLPPPPGGVREGRPYRDWGFRNRAGDEIQGWLVTPDGAGPFPTYLKVHGGPDWLYLDTWWPEVQMLVEAGFAVAMVNYRGSIGFGRRFRDHLIRNMGFPEVEDVVDGLDDLIARGIADPNRAVVGGRSWGGYVALLALGTHPERFAAGVAGVPIADYLGSYDESAPSLQAYDRTLVGGTVHERVEFVAERSPITYVDRVRAPVLIMVGEHDTRCVPSQSHTYIEALRAAGGDVQVYSYDEGHSTFLQDENVREHRTVLEFLERTVPR
jgi:acetyl esterase/lipase